MKGMHMLAIACVLSIVKSETDTKLYLWYNGYRDGEKTGQQYAVFEESGHSLTTCAKRCELEVECVSFFYSQPTGVCQGCDYFHGTRDISLPKMDNSRYYYQTFGWKQFGTSWYLMNRAKAPCNDAQDACVALGGNLVEITTSQENEFIGTLVSTEFSGPGVAYIGLNQFSGSFKWYGSDQSPVYAPWHPAHILPRSGLDCVFFDTGSWVSISSAIQFGFICEKNKCLY